MIEVTIGNEPIEVTIGDAINYYNGTKVESVNGKQGVVVLDHTDVGADEAGSASQALQDAKTYADSGLALKADTTALNSHTGDKNNPHQVTKTQVGLGNVTDDTQLKASQLDTDDTLYANSDDKVASQKATKTFVQGKIDTLGYEVGQGLDLKVDKVSGKGLSTEDYTTTDKNKLAGIANNATANDTDANLKNRANHTGEQAISTVTGLQTALDGKESTLNKKTDLSADSDVFYPTQKAVKTAIDTLSGEVSSALSGKVSTTGNETIAGVKTFSSSPIVPTATTNTQAVNKQQMDTADALKVNKAGDIMTGQLVAPSYDVGGVKLLSGTGFPNGVVSAPVGSTYIDTAATNGAIEWKKASGTGNTGWVVSSGSVRVAVDYANYLNGWADVSSGSRKIYLIRSDNMITLEVIRYTFSGASATVNSFLKVPVGFRHSVPGFHTLGTAYLGPASQAKSTAIVLVDTLLECRARDEVSFSISWPTDDPWPTTLPGTAV